MKTCLSILVSFAISVCARAQQSDEGKTLIETMQQSDEGKTLIDTMHLVNVFSQQAAPLAKQEFKVLDARFKGDQYNDLVARLRTPVELCNATNFESHFKEAVEKGDRDFVSAEILGAVDSIRALDGVLLAEALAGSSVETKLLQMYLTGEAALSHLNLAYQDWHR